MSHSRLTEGLLSDIEDVLERPPPMPEIDGMTHNSWVATAIYALVQERIRKEPIVLLRTSLN